MFNTNFIGKPKFGTGNLLSGKLSSFRWRMGIFVVLFAIVGSVVLFISFAVTPTNANVEADQINRINLSRNAQGLPSLKVSSCLTNAARDFAQHLSKFAKADPPIRLHHSDGGAPVYNPDGTLVKNPDGSIKTENVHAIDSATLIDYYISTNTSTESPTPHCPDGGWWLLGENAATGHGSEGIFNGFVKSDGHWANIVNPNFNYVGVGAYWEGDKVWIVQSFAKYTGNDSRWTNLPGAAAQNAQSATINAVATAAKRDGSGHWATDSAGRVVNYNSAHHYGDMSGHSLNKPIVGMAATPSGGGYWLVASDGGIFAFGNAAFYGSTGNISLNKPIVGMAATPSGGGYWLVASDGGIFAFGNAAFYGSTGNISLNKPIVGMAATPSGGGYWLVASDGGIFAFGNAAFYGSTGNISLNKPIVGMAATPSGGGYWLVASDGGIFAFGNAAFYGSAGSLGLSQVVGLLAMPDAAGYSIIQTDGTPIAYGSAQLVYGISVAYTNTPPTAPSNLRSTGVTASSASLAWDASSDNRGAISAYKIYRSGVYIGTTNGLSYTSSGLTPATAYSYKVSAVDSEGLEGGKSNLVYVVTREDTIAPSAPTGLILQSQNASEVKLKWNASSDNVAVFIYRVYRNGTHVGYTDSTSFTDNAGLVANTKYNYIVKAYDAVGNVSVGSNTAEVYFNVTPPTTPNLSSPNHTSTSINLAWTMSNSVVGVSYYGVYKVTFAADGSKIYTLIYTTNLLNHMVTGLSPNTSYSYAVKAVDITGKPSVVSNTVTIKTPSEIKSKSLRL